MGVPTQAWVFAFSIAIVPSQALAGSDPPEFILEWGSNGAEPWANSLASAPTLEVARRFYVWNQPGSNCST